jgi:hypothetical protein
VASEAVGKHKVSGNYGWIHDVGWQIEEWILSTGAYRYHRHLNNWWSTVICFVQFCTAGLQVIVSI